MSVAEEGAEDLKSQRTREFVVRVCLLLMSGSYTHNVSPMWMPQYKLSKVDSIKHSKVDRVKHIRFRLYTKNDTQRRNTRSRRNYPSQGRVDQLVVLCWMVTPRLIHGSSIIQTKQECIWISYIHAVIINDKRIHKVEEI